MYIEVDPNETVHPARRILGIHSGALGDVVLFAQLLSTLREPGVSVSLLAGGEKARFLAAIGAVEEALDFDALPIQEVFSDRPPEECSLPQRLGSCDWLISCFAQGDRKAEQRLKEFCGASRADFLPIRPGGGWSKHLLEAWAKQLRLPPVAPTPAWQITGEMRTAAERTLALAGADPLSPYVAIHIGSGSAAKCWPIEQFTRLADQLDLPCVFLMGPAEEDRIPAGRVDQIRRRCPLLVAPPLANLAGILGLAAAYVGNDSGPTHLAAALGTPTVALFGPSNATHFAPRGPKVKVLQHVPLAGLPLEEVLAAARGMASVT